MRAARFVLLLIGCLMAVTDIESFHIVKTAFKTIPKMLRPKVAPPHTHKPQSCAKDIEAPSSVYTTADGQHTPTLTVKVKHATEGEWNYNSDLNLLYKVIGEKRHYYENTSVFSLPIPNAKATDLKTYRFHAGIRGKSCRVTADIQLIKVDRMPEECPTAVENVGSSRMRLSGSSDQKLSARFDWTGEDDDSGLTGRWTMPSSGSYAFSLAELMKQNQTKRPLDFDERYMVKITKVNHLVRICKLYIRNVTAADVGRYLFEVGVNGTKCRGFTEMYLTNGSDAPKVTGGSLLALTVVVAMVARLMC